MSLSLRLLSFRRKPGSRPVALISGFRRNDDWMPDRVRHDDKSIENPCVLNHDPMSTHGSILILWIDLSRILCFIYQHAGTESVSKNLCPTGNGSKP